MSVPLFLYFPQWQGSGLSNEIYLGAQLLQNELAKMFSFTPVPVNKNENLITDHNVIGYKSIVSNLENVVTILNEIRPSHIFSLGGDCGIETGPISYLNQRYNKDLLVLWFDAHGDLNTPDSSPSKTFHGMPLRTLLGEGDPDLVSRLFSVLSPKQIVLGGTRDLDQPETVFIQENNIKLLSVEQLSETNLIQYVRNTGKKNIYLHFDLDVLDPTELAEVKVPTPGGITFKTAQIIIKALKNDFTVVGGSAVEYVPNSNRPDEKVISLVTELFNA